MADKPRLLDLFCGAGGASMGYHRAGWDVVGVDLAPQPRYPFEFVQGDALTYLDYLLDIGDLAPRKFDAIHASPPCQSYSRAMKHLAHDKPMLIDAVKERLVAAGVPWIIENVEGSPLPEQSDLMGRHGVMLCGTAFGLRVYRHRLFETSFPIEGPPCSHRAPAMNPHNQAGRNRIYDEFGRQDPEVVWRQEMGVGWMNKHEGRESIPPAFTEFVGRRMRDAVFTPQG